MDYPLIRHCTLAPSLNNIGLPSGLDHAGRSDISNNTGYNETVLRLLDDLGCSLLLLPRLKNENVIRHIGLITDIRFIGTPVLAMLVKIASAFQAGIVVLNIAEEAFPEMERNYARSYFSDKGMTVVNGLRIGLINLKKHVTKRRLEQIVAERQIDMLAATQQRKELLYQMAD